MALTQPMRAVGVFNQANHLEAALEELRDSNFPMDQISVIGRDAERRLGSEPKGQDITTTGAIAGGTVGGIVGLLIGLGTLAAIPGVGPVAFLGAAATALATTLTTGVLGATAGGLVGALVSYGIPADQATVYGDRIHHGDYFVMVEGSEADVRQAEAILSRWHIQELRIYNSTDPYPVPRPTDSMPTRPINPSIRSL